MNPPTSTEGERRLRYWDEILWDEGTRLETLLIVESHDELRVALAEQLRVHGYRVIEARSGEEALEAARMEFPDLVLLDLLLEDSSGRDIARQIREESWTEQLVVVALSSDPVLDESFPAFDHVLEMPASLNKLLDTIDRALQRYGIPGQRQSHEDQYTLDLRDRVVPEHLSLNTEVTGWSAFEAAPQNTFRIRRFRERLSERGIRVNSWIDAGHMVLQYRLSIADAFALGPTTTEEVCAALAERYPELRANPEALRRRVEQLSNEYNRLKRIAS